ncbi:hypothetical protein AB0D98_10900 [Streptomyces sp. NPDC047987]|uniref:hypothetical protein n=1 Tax=unclassified Streptomyces TaxID=2593676 RepID=UPI003442790C
MAHLDPSAAETVHYATDPRIRHLAEAAWRMRTDGTRRDWLMLGKNNSEALITEAREWVRAAVATGLLPAPSSHPAWKSAAHRAAEAEQGPKGLKPADRAAILREAADEIAGIDFHPNAVARSLDIATVLATRLRRLADEAQQVDAPTVADRSTDPLAGNATEYRVPCPENGGTELRVRRQEPVSGSGWAVMVPGYGGGRAWTREGWQEAISALCVDRLFCWPNAATAVDEARRALGATEEPTR